MRARGPVALLLRSLIKGGSEYGSMYPLAGLLLVVCSFAKSLGVRRQINSSNEDLALKRKPQVADRANFSESSHMGRLDIYEDEVLQAHDAPFNGTVNHSDYSQLKLSTPGTHANRSLVALRTKAVSWLQLQQEDWKDHQAKFVIMVFLFFGLVVAGILIMFLLRKDSSRASTATQTTTATTNDNGPTPDSLSSDSDSDSDPDLMQASVSVKTVGGHRRNSNEVLRGAAGELRQSLLRRHSTAEEDKMVCDGSRSPTRPKRGQPANMMAADGSRSPTRPKYGQPAPVGASEATRPSFSGAK